MNGKSQSILQIQRLKKKIMALLSGKFFLLSLVIVASGLFITNKYLASPLSEKYISKRQSIFISIFEARKKISPSKIIEMLESLTSIDNSKTWIHELNFKRNTLNLTIRSNDAESIERYINAVLSKNNNLILKNIVTKKFAFDKSSNEKKMKKKEDIPYALKLFSDRMQKKSKKNENSDTKKNNFIFNYETKVALFYKTT